MHQHQLLKLKKAWLPLNLTKLKKAWLLLNLTKLTKLWLLLVEVHALSNATKRSI